MIRRFIFHNILGFQPPTLPYIVDFKCFAPLPKPHIFPGIWSQIVAKKRVLFADRPMIEISH
jgi:hypothetical protein